MTEKRCFDYTIETPFLFLLFGYMVKRDENKLKNHKKIIKMSVVEPVHINRYRKTVQIMPKTGGKLKKLHEILTKIRACRAKKPMIDKSGF